MTDTVDEEIQVSLVPKEFVDSVWPEVKDYVESATRVTDGRYDVNSAYDLLIDYNYLLWVAFSTSKMHGAVITCEHNYPGKKALHVMFLGGVDAPKWKADMMTTLKGWAKDSGCDVVEGMVPLEHADAWKRVYKDDGFRPLWQTYELTVL